MLQKQLFEIMEDIVRNDQADKPTGNTPKAQVRKPATGSTGPAGAGTKPAPSRYHRCPQHRGYPQTNCTSPGKHAAPARRDQLLRSRQIRSQRHRRKLLWHPLQSRSRNQRN